MLLNKFSVLRQAVAYVAQAAGLDAGTSTSDSLRIQFNSAQLVVVVQPYLVMKNIYIIGAQSTGKTTLVNALEHAFTQTDGPFAAENQGEKPKVIREVARNVLKTFNFTRDDITTSPTRALQLQKHILKAQFEAEKEAAQPPNPWYIADRSGIDPIVYASMFVGEVAAQEMLASDEWCKLEECMKRGIVFLCEAGTRWLLDDGIRLMPENEEKWMEVDQTFRRLLEAREIDYQVVSNQVSDINERVKAVIEATCRHRAAKDSACAQGGVRG